MADVIRLTKAEVETLASQFKQAGSDTQDMLNNLGSAVQSAASGWEGDAYNAFVERFDTIKNDMKQVVEMYEGIDELLRGVIQTIEETDSGLASAVRG